MVACLFSPLYIILGPEPQTLLAVSLLNSTLLLFLVFLELAPLPVQVLHLRGLIALF
jgi:hypothetical protein